MGIEELLTEPEKILLSDGKERLLRFSNTSLKWLGQQYEGNPVKVATEFYGDAQKLNALAPEVLQAVECLIYAGLMSDYKDITPGYVSDHLPVKDIGVMGARALKCFYDSFPRQSGEGADDPTTGQTTGPGARPITA